MSRKTFVFKEALARLRILRRVRGPNRYWRERSGRAYAAEIQIEERGTWITVILLGKGHDLYMGMVSTHDEVVYYANNYNYPMLKALKVSDQKIDFFFLNPREFVENMERFSKWKSMVFLNFDEFKIPWNPLDYILDIKRLYIRVKN